MNLDTGKIIQNIYKYSYFYNESDYPLITTLRKQIIKLFSNRIEEDLQYLYKNQINNISLCAKWILRK